MRVPFATSKVKDGFRSKDRVYTLSNLDMIVLVELVSWSAVGLASRSKVSRGRESNDVSNFFSNFIFWLHIQIADHHQLLEGTPCTARRTHKTLSIALGRSPTLIPLVSFRFFFAPFNIQFLPLPPSIKLDQGLVVARRGGCLPLTRSFRWLRGPKVLSQFPIPPLFLFPLPYTRPALHHARLPE